MDNPALPPLYGVKSAPGILIAVGSVGHYLSNNPQELSTFVSEDGGLTWRHIADGPHMYEIGDQGGLIVMAEFKKTTDLVKFTLILVELGTLSDSWILAKQQKVTRVPTRLFLCLTSSWSLRTTAISS